jgi:hypothetical protein
MLHGRAQLDQKGLITLFDHVSPSKTKWTSRESCDPSTWRVPCKGELGRKLC